MYPICIGIEREEIISVPDWFDSEAHHVTGRIVAAAEASAVPLDKLPLEVMQEAHSGITEDVFSVLSVRNSVKSRTSYGGTAPQNVTKMARQWLKRLEKERGKG